MRKFIQKNRKLLPDLYSIYEKHKKRNLVEIVPSKQGSPTMKIDGNFIHSSYNPIKEAMKFGKDKIKDKEIIFILGLGLGYHVEELVKKTNATIVIIEMSYEVFSSAFEYRDLSFLKNTNLFIGKSDELQNFLQSIIPEETCKHSEILRLSALVNVCPNEYIKAAEIINKVLSQKLQSYMTTMAFGYRWISNILRNSITFNDVNTPCSTSNVPIFIVASGPSLDDAMPYLSLLKNKGILLCLSHSLAALLDNGIIPHGVLAIDGGYAIIKHFIGLDYSQLSNTFLITTLSVNHLLDKIWKGKKSIVNITLPLEEDILPGAIKLPVSGTVAATALQLARSISKGPYFFVGLDLAFTNGKYHHSGSLAEISLIYKSDKFNTPDSNIKRLLRKFNTIEVKSRGEGKVKTNMAMASYKDWFELEFENINIYILGKGGCDFKNSEYKKYNYLNHLPDVNLDFNAKQISIAKKRYLKRINGLLNIISNNLEIKNDNAIKMATMRYLRKEEELNNLLKKIKKIFNKIKNVL